MDLARLPLRRIVGRLAEGIDSTLLVLLLTWYGDGTVQSVAAYLITWLLLLAAPRPLVELLAAGRRRGRTSDPDQLARLTRVPAVLWILVLLAANLAGLVVGVSTLAPEVV